MKLYCSECGRELTHTRKAVKGKGYIANLVEPHECSGYAVHANEDEQPTILDILDSLKSISHLVEGSTEKSEQCRYTNPSDLRSEIRKSTAPTSLIRGLRSLPNSEDTDEML